MKTAKLLKLAYAAQFLGRELFAERSHGHHTYVRTRRHAWVARGAKAARHPFVAGFGGVFLGLLAFVLVMMALGAVFALVGLVLKIALAVGAVYLAVRFVRAFKRQGAEVMIVPPDMQGRAPRRF